MKSERIGKTLKVIYHSGGDRCEFTRRARRCTAPSVPITVLRVFIHWIVSRQASRGGYTDRLGSENTGDTLIYMKMVV